jgi:hypothetical protein
VNFLVRHVFVWSVNGFLAIVTEFVSWTDFQLISAVPGRSHELEDGERHQAIADYGCDAQLNLQCHADNGYACCVSKRGCTYDQVAVIFLWAKARPIPRKLPLPEYLIHFVLVKAHGWLSGRDWDW